LGTFLVRSGVLTSVHSFAADPSRGLFILLLLALSVCSSLLLFGLKSSDLNKTGSYDLFSRETALLVANILLVVATLTVLLGTLYPLIIDALGMGKISVGPPYFNSVFVPLMYIMFIFMGAAPLLRWKKAKAGVFQRQLTPLALIALLLGGLFPLIYGGEFNLSIALAMSLAIWIVLGTVKSVLQSNAITYSLSGMAFAHIGVAVCVIGIACVSVYEKEMSVKMFVDKPVAIEGYNVIFKGVRPLQGANYEGEQGKFEVYRDHDKVATLFPERRRYNGGGMPMTEAGIDPGLFRDIYIALGEPVDKTAWAIRLNYKPMVRWIWLGSLLMAIGACLGLIGKRTRVTSKAPHNSINPVYGANV
jgi:cytochrome c-type biogenesis protein CcmF